MRLGVKMYGFGKPVKKKYKYIGRNSKRYASDEYGKHIMRRRKYAINSDRTISQEELKLREITKQVFKEYTPRYNDRNQLKGLELDIFFPQLKIAIEYNGEGHYSKNDKLKKELCFNKDIKLLIIEQIDNNYKVKKQIRNFLLTYNIHILKSYKEATNDKPLSYVESQVKDRIEVLGVVEQEPPMKHKGNF